MIARPTHCACGWLLPAQVGIDTGRCSSVSKAALEQAEIVMICPSCGRKLSGAVEEIPATERPS